MSDITVIIPIYLGTDLGAFVAAIKSIFDQSKKADKIIIAIDGPLKEELKLQIEEYANRKDVDIVESEVNIGLGRILKLAQSHVNTELIARMDSDDISMPDRLEKQLKFLRDHDLDILGSFIQERSKDGNTYIRKVPLSKEDILDRVEYRSPFNHVTILMKKAVLLENENYEDCLYAEDWYLWLRLLKNHKELKFANIPDITVDVNTDEYSRLNGYRRFKFDMQYLGKFKREGLIGWLPYWINVISSFIVRLILGKRAKWFYTKILRSKK